MSINYEDLLSQMETCRGWVTSWPNVKSMSGCYTFISWDHPSAAVGWTFPTDCGEDDTQYTIDLQGVTGGQLVGDGWTCLNDRWRWSAVTEDAATACREAAACMSSELTCYSDYAGNGEFYHYLGKYFYDEAYFPRVGNDLQNGPSQVCGVDLDLQDLTGFVDGHPVFTAPEVVVSRPYFAFNAVVAGDTRACQLRQAGESGCCKWVHENGRTRYDCGTYRAMDGPMGFSGAMDQLDDQERPSPMSAPLIVSVVGLVLISLALVCSIGVAQSRTEGVTHRLTRAIPPGKLEYDAMP